MSLVLNIKFKDICRSSLMYILLSSSTWRENNKDLAIGDTCSGNTGKPIKSDRIYHKERSHVVYLKFLVSNEK